MQITLRLVYVMLSSCFIIFANLGIPYVVYGAKDFVVFILFNR